MHKPVVILWGLLILWSCNSRKPSFPPVQDLSTYPSTLFLPTLEHSFPQDQNAIYCATLLFAWDEIRQQLPGPLIIPGESEELILLNRSNTFKNVLAPDEYEVRGEIEENGNRINLSATFALSLPFEMALESFPNYLLFDSVQVNAFGLMGNNFEQSQAIQILNYQNDNSFCLKLLPEGLNHEIILFKTPTAFGSLDEAFKTIKQLIIVGEQEKQVPAKQWKYTLQDDDETVIPCLAFNIETHFQHLEGQAFQAQNQRYVVEQAWQRTAFLLNEEGAKIESDSEWAVEMEESMEMEEELPRPKRLIFDRPFYIFLKRTDAAYPYFGCWVVNSALMEKG